MAARLVWRKRALLLDGKEVARIKRWGVGGWAYRISFGDVFVETEVEKYEVQRDCQQDCESEVRRLLKGAGVEVIP
jgi:hypothetical protein